jgi:hypothetical protein
MLESDLEAVWLAECRKYDAHTIKLHPFVAGIPDRLVIFPTNRFFLVELKTPTGTLDKLQVIWHRRRLKRQGVKVHVVYGAAQARQWIREAAAGDHDAPSRVGPPTT